VEGQAGAGEGVARAVEVRRWIDDGVIGMIVVVVDVASAERVSVTVDVVVDVNVVVRVCTTVIVFIEVRSRVVGTVVTLVIVALTVCVAVTKTVGVMDVVVV
jgi:hypothetical protein